MPRYCPQSVPTPGANPEELYIQREKEQILSFVIDRLPPLLQGAVRLYLDDLTVEEVGQCLGVRIPTVKARPTVCDGERPMS